MIPSQPLQRLLVAWPVAGAVMGLFVAIAHGTGVQADTPLLVYLGLIWIPLVIGTLAWQGPSKEAFSAGCQGAAVASVATLGVTAIGFALSAAAALAFGAEIGQRVGLIMALTAFLSIGVGAAFAPITLHTTRRTIAAATAGWIVGLLLAAGLLVGLVVLAPHATTPDAVWTFLLGCVLCVPSFASIALRDRLLSLQPR